MFYVLPNFALVTFITLSSSLLGYMFGFENDFHIRLLNLGCQANPYLHFSWPLVVIFDKSSTCKVLKLDILACK